MDVDAALSEVPVNLLALTDDTDFKTREESVVYNQAGLDLLWNFITTAGAFTQTAVTPTDTAGDYDWVNQGNGHYTIEIPASGGASINNDSEGFGYFSGFATGILPWRGPVIGFRAAGLNNALIDSAYSATRGLAGTALPDAVADAATGLPVSDAGGLDLDTILDVAISTRLAPTTAARTLDVNATGEAGLDLDNTSGTWSAAQFAAAFITASKFGASAIDAAAISADFTQEVMADWLNGGRLDLILDIIAADTTTDIPALIATAQADLDIITGATGANLLAATQASIDATETNAARLTAARAGALTDWINGGRLDLILDIIAADTTTDIPALIAALENISQANVLTQVNAGLDTAIPELTAGVPTATPSIRTGLQFLYMGVRNRRDTTSNSDEIYNDAGAVIATAVLSDDTVTYISGEYA